MSVHVDRVRGTWLFIFDLPRAPDGRRRQMMRRGFADEQTAAVAEQAARRHAGIDIALPVAGSVAGELVRWLRERELDIAITSLATYRTIVRRYLIPHLGDQQLHALDRYEIHDMYRHLLQHGSHTSGPLSPATVRQVHRVLMKALKDLPAPALALPQQCVGDAVAATRLCRPHRSIMQSYSSCGAQAATPIGSHFQSSSLRAACDAVQFIGQVSPPPAVIAGAGRRCSTRTHRVRVRGDAPCRVSAPGRR